MASLVSTGSPRLSRRSTPNFKVLDEIDDDMRTPTNSGNTATRGQIFTSKVNAPTPLQSDTLSNLQAVNRVDKPPTASSAVKNHSGMEEILARLHLNDSRKVGPAQLGSVTLNANDDALDQLLTNLNGQHHALKKQGKDLEEESASGHNRNADRSSSSDQFTPASGSYGIESASDSQDSETVNFDAAEILRVKKELEAAKSVISRQEQELAETRTLKHTMDQAIGPPSEVDFGNYDDISEQTIGHLQSAFNASARPFTSRNAGWQLSDDGRSDQSDALSAAGLPKSRGIWNGQQAGLMNSHIDLAGCNGAVNNPRDGRIPGNSYGCVYGDPQSTVDANFGPGRNFSSSSVNSFAYDPRLTNDLSVYSNTAMRRNQPQLRTSSTMSNSLSPYGNFQQVVSTLSPPPLSPMGVSSQYGYSQRAIGAPVSPMTSEFPNGTIQGLGSQWPLSSPNASSQTYVTPLEPMNYRRLLDKSVSCDWKYIVDKIVCNNDQQASIFLQQKLKVGTAEQKFEIVESIVNQAYPLMINRFGNFLVQRCFEHGTPDQVVAIASAIHGNVLSLSMDPFGCHVIQKAFDSVPENHKADMVRELLRRIPDTVIHRYACHVWQKLFELRWSGEPPQIMLKVNEALRGMWHEVALGETGSLVVQNIFENCVEEEKRPAIEEVIANIDLIAHGQFGNWCIQHLCEHGSPPDKRRVIDHILTNSYNYSIDQFASKVVEKCLKIGGIEFLDRYLGVITTAHPDRPRIPLIDIAGDQYGNYLIQWILMNTHQHQREQVAIHIRKHMVSLRGSKFGSRVAMLCCNPSSITRPGPGAMVNPYGAPGQPRTPWARFR